MRLLLPLLLVGAIAHSIFGPGDEIRATSTCAQWNAASVAERTDYTSALYTDGGALQARVWIDGTCAVAHDAGHDAETIPDPTLRP
jgi:hypothetical protein